MGDDDDNGEEDDVGRPEEAPTAAERGGAGDGE